MDLTEPDPTRSVIAQYVDTPAKRWESADLGVHPDGNWLMFYKKSTNKAYNNPRLKNLECPVSYRHVPYNCAQTQPVRNLNNTSNNDLVAPNTNYNAFRFRRKIYTYGVTKENERTNLDDTSSTPTTDGVAVDNGGDNRPEEIPRKTRNQPTTNMGRMVENRRSAPKLVQPKSPPRSPRRTNRVMSLSLNLK